MSIHSDEFLGLFETLHALRRPKLLMQTARHGLADYDRARDLRRILRLPAAPPQGPGCVAQLLALEAEMERRRTRHGTEPGSPWRAAQHIEALIALLSESAAILQPAGRGTALEPSAAPDPEAPSPAVIVNRVAFPPRAVGLPL